MNFNYKIHILDCTLRDGGYVNNWNFGKKAINKITSKLGDSFTDIIEAGFLSHKKQYDEDQSIFDTIDRAEQIIQSKGNNIALMINCGEYSADDIPEYRGSAVATIRIAFHKHQRIEAQELCLKLKKKGYKVFFQPMVTMGYTDLELLDLIEWANQNHPEAFYIVDSFGTMRKNDVLRFAYLIDNNLAKDIMVGFHSHNNLQLSFSNAQELINLNLNRGVIVDSSVFGMGRGAGNLCTELLMQYLNENCCSKYDILPIIEAMDECIMPIYAQHPWGYSIPYYIAANNHCHPNYATYLMNRQTLCIRDINSIIKSIPLDMRNLFDKKLISRLYNEYQEKNIDDSTAISEIERICNNRNVLILAPGKSILTKKDSISRYISENNPIIFGINHIPKYHKCDCIFISNLRRFNSIDEALRNAQSKVICTSNISTDENVMSVNYSSYLVDDDAISDNSGLMLINILRKAGVTSIALAGYDGFKYAENRNYYDENLVSNIQFEKRELTNQSITNYFSKLRRSMNVNFITPTIYDNGEADE